MILSMARTGITAVVLPLLLAVTGMAQTPPATPTQPGGPAQTAPPAEIAAGGRELLAVPGAPGSEAKPGEQRSVHYPAPNGPASLDLVFVSSGGDRSEVVRAPIG